MVRLIESSVNQRSVWQRSIWSQCSIADPMHPQGDCLQLRGKRVLHQKGSRCCAELACNETNRSTLGLARGAKHLTLEGIETVRRREEAEAAAVADDDPRGLGADLDD